MRLKHLLLCGSALNCIRASAITNETALGGSSHFWKLSEKKRHNIYHQVSKDGHNFPYYVKAIVLVISLFQYWYPLYYNKNDWLTNFFLSVCNKEDFDQRQANLKVYNDFLQTVTAEDKKKDAENIFEIGEAFKWNLEPEAFTTFTDFLRKKVAEETANIPTENPKLGTEKLREKFNDDRMTSAAISYITIVTSIFFFAYSHVFSLESCTLNLFSNFLSAFPMLLSISIRTTSSYDRYIVAINYIFVLLALNITFLVNHGLIHNKAVQLAPEKIQEYLTI